MELDKQNIIGRVRAVYDNMASTGHAISHTTIAEVTGINSRIIDDESEIEKLSLILKVAGIEPESGNNNVCFFERYTYNDRIYTFTWLPNDKFEVEEKLVLLPEDFQT